MLLSKTKSCLLFVVVISVVFVVSCEKKIELIINNGEKQYKKDNGELAQAEWVTIDGNDYFFDMNGYLQTNQWIDDKYYVNNEGRKLKKEWYIDKTNSNTYYLSSNGEYLKNTLANIQGKDYYFDASGCLIKDKIFKNNEDKLMYADINGVIANQDKVMSINGYYYYINKMGIIYQDGWKEIDGKWYYFYPENGEMAQDKWIDATYYFDNEGKMLKNGKSPEGYEVDSDGKVLSKYKSKLLAKDFHCIFKEYCDSTWAKVGEDDSFISIEASEDMDKVYAIQAIKQILKVLEFPDYVYEKIINTSLRDGKQMEEKGEVSFSWSYSGFSGIEAMLIKKNSD